MRHHSDKHMTKKTILATIDFIKKQIHNQEHFFVSFFGGEALLQFHNILFIIEDLEKEFGEKVSFDISTNGFLLQSEDIINQLLKHDVGISVSLDGCKEIHDKNRMLLSGEKTFDQIVVNLLNFKRKYPKEYNKRIRILVTAGSLTDIMTMNKNIEQFKNLIGVKKPFISHIFPNFAKGEFYNDKISLKRKFLDKAIEHKKEGKYDFYTIILDDLLKKSNKKFQLPEQCSIIHLKTCFDSMYSIFINTDGLLFPCEKFDTEHSIGDIQSGIKIRQLKKWSHIYNLKRTFLCSNCNIIEYCTRCLADLKMSYSEQKQMCAIYRENINLSQVYNNNM